MTDTRKAYLRAVDDMRQKLDRCSEERNMPREEYLSLGLKEVIQNGDQWCDNSAQHWRDEEEWIGLTVEQARRKCRFPIEYRRPVRTELQQFNLILKLADQLYAATEPYVGTAASYAVLRDARQEYATARANLNREGSGEG